jgi:hypothetical protein
MYKRYVSLVNILLLLKINCFLNFIFWLYITKVQKCEGFFSQTLSHYVTQAGLKRMIPAVSAS